MGSFIEASDAMSPRGNPVSKFAPKTGAALSG
jgi:hypothetical protein